MNSSRKILFTDLDGTLLNDKKEISPGNQAAIDDMLAQGHVLAFSTGRPLPSALMLAERLGLHRDGCYAVTYNGGQIYDLYRRETIYSRPVLRALIRPLFDAATRRGIHIQTYSSTHVLAERPNTILDDYRNFTGIPYRIVKNIDDAMDTDPYKLLAIKYDAHKELLDFQSELRQTYPGTVDSFFSSDSYLEIVPAGVSKGEAVRWMCSFLQIPLSNSVAAGDAPNDVSMLEAAHIGAAMRNSFPGVTEHADYVTEADNNHDGVAEIIRRKLLS